VLWKKGRDVSEEIRAIKALADAASRKRTSTIGTGASS
jgi:hypothetical protein